MQKVSTQLEDLTEEQQAMLISFMQKKLRPDQRNQFSSLSLWAKAAFFSQAFLSHSRTIRASDE